MQRSSFFPDLENLPFLDMIIKLGLFCPRNLGGHKGYIPVPKHFLSPYSMNSWHAELQPPNQKCRKLPYSYANPPHYRAATTLLNDLQPRNHNLIPTRSFPVSTNTVVNNTI